MSHRPDLASDHPWRRGAMRQANFTPLWAVPPQALGLEYAGHFNWALRRGHRSRPLSFAPPATPHALLAVGLLTAAAAGLLGYGGPGVVRLIGVTVTAGLLAVLMIFAVGYYAATASFRFGLDPDNVGIPLVTSTMDFVGILCLTVGIVVIL